MPRCDHCLLDFPAREAVTAEFDGTRKVFCCNGCKGIYRLIFQEGLTSFYERRQSWSPGPSEGEKIDPSAFVPGLRQAGGEIELDLIIDGIRCASCVWLNEKILRKTKGVASARVNYATHRARVRWRPEETDLAEILRRIASFGYSPKPYEPKLQEEEIRRMSRDLLIRFGTAAFFSSQLMLYSIALYAGYFQGMDQEMMDLFHIISLVLTTPVLFYSGWPFLKGAVRGLRHLTFNMDVLITAGSVSAYVYSVHQMLGGREVYFDTAAMIVTLILLGRYIEVTAKGRASETISRLLSLSPREARLVDRDSSERRMTPIRAIGKGDLIEVIPGERIPLDGVVGTGASETDESMLTGESMPVPKAPGSEVFAGTVNLHGSFVFKVIRTGEETVLSTIIRAVEDAQSRRAPIQAFADRVVGLFVPAILVLSILTFAFWLLAAHPVTEAVMNAVSVLVIACPCALGLATPLAILVGTTYGASKGILIKGGDVIEKAGRVDFVVFDKTGTVTTGRPSLSFFRGIGISDNEALRLAASVERLSEHSIGRALVAAAGQFHFPEVKDLSAVPGKGIKGMISGKEVTVGSIDYIEATVGEEMVSLLDPQTRERLDELEGSGATVVFLAVDRRPAGIFAVSDEIRGEAEAAVRRLNDRGVGMEVLTGDAMSTAIVVAGRVGIGTVRARMSPMGKAEEIRRLKGEGRRVAMVGDGINDAPALVEADVGLSMGRATDIAIESADITIMRPDLRLIPEALRIASKTFAITRQNIFWAFLYNVTAVPLAIAGMLHPIVAAAAMALSSLSVVANSLRAGTA